MKLASFVSIFVPITLIALTIKNLDRGMRIMFVLLLAGLVAEIVTLSHILPVEANRAIFHLYKVFEVNLILIMLFSWYRHALFWVVMAIFNILTVIHFSIFPIASLNTHFDAFASLCILVGMAAIARDFTFSKINNVGTVVVTASFAWYFSIMFFLYALSNQGGSVAEWCWKWIHSPLNILTYLGVSYGVYAQYNSNKLHGYFDDSVNNRTNPV